MKQKCIPLLRRYAVALEKHLAQTSPASLFSALGLGREMVAGGLGTLELAKFHDQAVIALLLPGHSPGKKAGITRRAVLFFNEANVAIEETHRGARRIELHLQQLRKSLSQRTKALTAAELRLKKGIAKRKSLQDAYGDSERAHRQCLAESLQLQSHLRQLCHQVFAAGEAERTRISHELQDEIVQTLVGINVRLLCLQKESRTNSKGIKKHIANAQRLVVRSAESVHRLAQELDSPLLAKRRRAGRNRRVTAAPVAARTHT